MYLKYFLMKLDLWNYSKGKIERKWRLYKTYKLDMSYEILFTIQIYDTNEHT